MPEIGRLCAAAFSRPVKISRSRCARVPVDVLALGHDLVGEAVNFLQRDEIPGQGAEHDTTAFGPEIDGEVMVGAHGKSAGIDGRGGIVNESKCS